MCMHLDKLTNMLDVKCKRIKSRPNKKYIDLVFKKFEDSKCNNRKN